MRGREHLLTVLVVAIAVFIALDGGLFFFRVDLTEDHIFTLSEASRNLYRSLSEPAAVTYYVSQRLRKISPIPQEVEDLLHEYAVYSHGKITVRSVDPAKAEVAREMKAIGIYPEQMEIIDKSERTTAQIYSGIDIQYLDREAVIPFVGGTNNLEYRVTAAMMKLIQNRNWTVGILVGDSQRTLQNDYSLLAGSIGRTYTPMPIARGAPIPRSLDALVVLGGRDLSKVDLAPIDRYVMEGGPVFFCIPGVAVDTRGSLQATPLIGLPVLDLVASYGVGIANTLVLDKSVKDFRTLRMVGGQYAWQDLGFYPHWLRVRREDVSRTSPITKNFEGLDLLWASPLVKLDLPGIHYDSLAKSTRAAWIMKGSFQTNPYDVSRYDSSGDQTPGQYDLVYALRGRFPSFEGGAASGAPAVLSPPTRIIVVGDDDFLSDLIHYSDSAYNLGFAGNAIDWLAGNDALLTIKTKGQWDPRLDRIEDPNAKRAAFRFAEVVNIFLVPLGVVLFGLRRSLVRRRKQLAAERGT